MYSPESEKRIAVIVSQLRAILDNVPFAAWFKDLDGKYMAVNKAKETLSGLSESEMRGKTDYELFNEAIGNRMSLREAESISLKRQVFYEEQVENEIWEELFVSPIFDKDGVVIGTTGLWRDITDQKKQVEEIAYLNHHDQMTGLKNRFYFESAIRMLDNVESLPISIIMIDVNGLKLTNDLFGYHEGDRLLKEIAGILLKYSRKDDVIARIGGDEFCILMPRTNLETAKKISCLIIEECETFDGESRSLVGYPSISVGYAAKNDFNDKISEIMAHAEELMYKRKLLELKSGHSSLVNSIKTTLFEKSHETEEHAERLVELSNKVGLEMGLDDKDLNELNLLAALHDIGKMGVDDYILCKPGKLTEQEWEAIYKHPEVGFRIANSSPELTAIADYILCHHERWDGAGYPKGLKKRNIPLLSRIIAVVDAYDAMTQDRSYRKAKAEEHAIVEIIKNSGSQFDPDVAIVFIKIINENINDKERSFKTDTLIN